ncbi:MAG: NINE protein [Patescibacteria group bacterium]
MQKKNKFVAVLLALVFGFFGIHLFYLGKNAGGVSYLAASFIALFCYITVILSPIGLIIDLILFILIIIDIIKIIGSEA